MAKPFPTTAQELDAALQDIVSQGASQEDVNSFISEYKRRKGTTTSSKPSIAPTSTTQPAPVMGPPVPTEIEGRAQVQKATKMLQDAQPSGIITNIVKEAAGGLKDAASGVIQGGKELFKGPEGDPMQGTMTAGEGLLRFLFSPFTGAVKSAPDEGIAGAPRKIIEKVGELPADAGVKITSALGEALGADTSSQEWKDKVERPIADTINLGMAIFGTRGKRVRGAVEKALDGTSDVIKNSAKKNVETILNPTKEKNKAAVRNKGEAMLETMPLAITREGLLNKLDKIEKDFGKKVGEYKEMVGIGGQVTKKHLLDVLEKSKIDENFMDTKGRILNPEGVKAVDTVKEIIQQYDDVIPLAELDPLRQSLGDQIAMSRGFDLPIEEQTKTGQKRKLYGEIAEQTAKQNPELALKNKDYSTARKTAEVLDATLQRKTGQTGIVDKAVKYTPAVAGAIAGTAALSGILTVPALVGAGITGLVAVSRSTLWNLISGKTKLKISKAIKAGKPALLNAADFAEITAVAGQALKENKLKPEDITKLKSAIPAPKED